MGAVLMILILGAAQWNFYLLAVYILAFCLVQAFLEIFVPRFFLIFIQMLSRFWGLGLLYVLTGILLVAVGSPDSNAAAQFIMAFAAGVIMFGIGVLYVLLGVVSCGKCLPIPCCARCGHRSSHVEEGEVYH